MNYCTNERCIKANNVNLTLKNIFKFIVQNQIYADGTLQETTLLLKISLTDIETPTTENRVSVENTVTGIITEIADTYVVILAKKECSLIYSEYTVEYSKIIYLYNIIFYRRYNQFKDYILCNVPKICYEKGNVYIDIIDNLKEDLIKYKNDNNIKFKVIFSQVNSRDFYNEDIAILKNFVLIGRYFLFPFTSIDGYILTPSCTQVKASSNFIIHNDGFNKGGDLFV